jgi:hypothetical protein
MGVPVPKVFDLGKVAFDLPKYLLLVSAILKKSHSGTARLRTGLDDAADAYYQLAPVLLKRPNNSSAGFVLIEPVALIENRCKGSFRQD